MLNLEALWLNLFVSVFVLQSGSCTIEGSQCSGWLVLGEAAALPQPPSLVVCWMEQRSHPMMLCRLSAVFSSCGWSRPVAHCDAACELRLHGASVEAGEDAGVHAQRLQSPQGVQSLASFPDHSDCATRTNDIKTWYCWVPLADLQQSVDSKTRDRVLLCSYVNSFTTTPLDVRSSTRLNGFNRPGWRWQWRMMRDEVRKQVSGAWAWWRRPEESEWSLVFAHYSTAG